MSSETGIDAFYEAQRRGQVPLPAPMAAPSNPMPLPPRVPPSQVNPVQENLVMQVLKGLGLGATGALGQIADVLRIPGNVLATPPAMLGQVAGLTHEGGMAGLSETLHRLLTNDTAGTSRFVQAGAGALSASPLGMAYRAVPLPNALKQTGLEMAVDPLTYVGFGVPGRLLRGATNPELIAILTRLQRADDAYNALQASVLADAGQGIRRAGNIPLGPLGKAMPYYKEIPALQVPGGIDFEKVTPQTLGEWWTGRAKSTHLAKYRNTLLEGGRLLGAKGHDILTDLFQARTGFVPPETPRTLQELLTSITEMDKGWIDEIMALPGNERLIGMNFYRAAQDEVWRGFERVALAQREAQQAGLSAREVAARTRDAVALEFGEHARTLEAGRQALTNFLRTNTGALGSISDFGIAGAKTIDNLGSDIMAARHGRDVGLMRGATQQEREMAQQQFREGVMQSVDQRTRDAVRLAQGPIPDAVRRGIDPVEATTRVAQTLDQLRQANIGSHIPGFMADLPPGLDSRFGHWWKDLTGPANQYKNALGYMENALKKAWTESGIAAPFPERYIPHNAPGSQRLQYFNDVLGQMGLDPIENVTQLPDRLGRILPTQSVNSLRQQIAKWSGDILTDNPYELVVDIATRAKEKELAGARLPGKFGDFQDTLSSAWQDATSFMRASLLMTTSYVAVNIMGALLNAGIGGIRPNTLLPLLWRNIGRMARGEASDIPAVSNARALLGLPAPASTSREASGRLPTATAAREFSGRGVDILNRLGPAKLALGFGGITGAGGGLQAAQEGKSPGEVGLAALKGGLAGAAFGAATPKLSRLLLQNIGGGIEEVVRQGTWAQVVAEGVNGAQATLRQIIDNAAGATPRRYNPTAAAMNVRGQAFRRPAMGQAANAVYTDIMTGNIPGGMAGWISGENLARLMVDKGFDPNVARAAGKEWEAHLFQISKEGEDLAGKTQFRYDDLNNFEDLLRRFTLFSTWTAKAWPFYAEALLSHPGVMLGLLRYAELNNESKQEGNLTGRFSGSSRNDPISQFWSAMLGRPVEVFNNPIRAFVPFGDLERSVSTGRDDESLPEAAVRALSAVGMSPNPMITAFMRTIGMLGTESSPQAAIPIRQASLLEAISGANPNRAQEIVEGNIRRGLGQNPSDMRLGLIEKRIDELALKETGKPITAKVSEVAPYQQAKLGRTGEIWDRAEAEVMKELRFRGLGSMAFAPENPTAILTPEEKQIRAAKATTEAALPPALITQISTAASQNPDAPADPKIVAQLRTMAEGYIQQNLGGTPPPEHTAAFANPTNRAMFNVLRGLQNEQAAQTPEARGYSGFGSPEERQLSALISLYTNPAALMESDPAFRALNLSPEAKQGALRMMTAPPGPDHASKRAKALLDARKELLLKQYPILAQYLAYQAENRGAGNVAEFLSKRTRQDR